MRDPLRDLREALAATGDTAVDVVHPMHLDHGREARTGIPEVVMVAGKDVATVLAVTRSFLDQNGRAILSRIRPATIRVVRDAFPDHRVEEAPRARMAVVRRPDYLRQPTGGRVGIITAGSSDAPIAEQAEIIAQEMGCETTVVYDVGVAGLHRLISPLQRMIAEAVDVIIVAAGMDGALPSVVAGLVDVPVIGLPTSTGYGAGGQGLAALLSMLQTCVPGLTVVNVDNGIGAGASAARIANQLAASRARAAGAT
ncbi:MAG: pyridinium-3,5-biscarboxylic acid mononucleotide synthase [Chloroflexota bacterium]|nr:pyridinium-3,5-biscarboxylic acid mononucleotide synthase [Chloroflexota bacterium]